MAVQLHPQSVVAFDHPSDHAASVLLHDIGVVVEDGRKGIILRRGPRGRKTKPPRPCLSASIWDFLEQGPIRFVGKNHAALLLALAMGHTDDPIEEALDPLENAITFALFSIDEEPGPPRAGTVIQYERRDK